MVLGVRHSVRSGLPIGCARAQAFRPGQFSENLVEVRRSGSAAVEPVRALFVSDMPVARRAVEDGKSAVDGDDGARAELNPLLPATGGGEHRSEQRSDVRGCVARLGSYALDGPSVGAHGLLAVISSGRDALRPLCEVGEVLGDDMRATVHEQTEGGVADPAGHGHGVGQVPVAGERQDLLGRIWLTADAGCGDGVSSEDAGDDEKHGRRCQARTPFHVSGGCPCHGYRHLVHRRRY